MSSNLAEPLRGVPAGRKLRVVHLAPGHPAFDTRVFHKEAVTLVHAGYDVTVVALGERDDMVDGVRIVALPRPVNRAGRFLLDPLRLLRIARSLRADVYHVHDIEALPVGVAMAAAGACVIWDSHEDYPRLALDRPWLPTRLRPLVARVVARAERMAVASMSAVVSAEQIGARRFPAAKTVVIRNVPLRREFAAVGPSFAGRANTLVYVGDITRQRGAREMVELVGRLPEHLDARLVLVGRLAEPSLHDELRAMPGWERVDYRGHQDRDGVRAALHEARVGLVLWHPTRKHAEGAVPVKLLEYMASGLPVVASDFPALREEVEAANGGVLVDPLAVEELVGAVTKLLSADASWLERMGARSRQHVLGTGTWETESHSLLDLYRRLADAP